MIEIFSNVSKFDHIFISFNYFVQHLMFLDLKRSLKLFLSKQFHPNWKNCKLWNAKTALTLRQSEKVSLFDVAFLASQLFRPLNFVLQWILIGFFRLQSAAFQVD